MKRTRKQEVAIILNYDKRHGIKHVKGSTLEKNIEKYYMTKRGYGKERADKAAGATVGKVFRRKLALAERK